MKYFFLFFGISCAHFAFSQDIPAEPFQVQLEPVKWVHYYMSDFETPKRIVDKECDAATVTTLMEVEQQDRRTPNDICNQVIYLEDSLYKLETTPEELEQIQTTFLFKPQGRTKFLVQVGNQIYTVYCERHCICPDPMCEAKHGHMQTCSTRYFTKEFGTLFSSNETIRRTSNDFYIQEAENRNSDINALVYYILAERTFSPLQQDHQLFQLYLNR